MAQPPMAIARGRSAVPGRGREEPRFRVVSSGTPSSDHDAVLSLQRQVGNRAVTQMLASPRRASLAEVEASARGSDEVIATFAGTTQAQPAPRGLAGIVARGSGGFTAGYTGIKSAAAFGPPTIATRNVVRRVQRPGYSYPTPRHYAVLQPTTATDATHESLYPAAGLHPVRSLNRTYLVTGDISDRIREGEQEHLDDARRAFDLTYGRVAEVINDLATRAVEFGPADTPAAAERLALQRLASLLGPLTCSPGRWRQLLDDLLGLSKSGRDGRGWHAFTSQLAFRRGRRVFEVTEGPNARIGVPSDQVVNLPGGDVPRRPSAQTSGTSAPGPGRGVHGGRLPPRD